MKKITAVLAAMLLIACLFAACGGTGDGKVTDTTNNDIPVITTDNSLSMTNSFEDGSVSDTSDSGILGNSTENNSVTNSATNNVGM